MAACILPHYPVANNKAKPNKIEKCSVSNARVASMVGDRNHKNLDHRFYDIKEHKTLSIDDK